MLRPALAGSTAISGEYLSVRIVVAFLSAAARVEAVNSAQGQRAGQLEPTRRAASLRRRTWTWDDLHLR